SSIVADDGTRLFAHSKDGAFSKDATRAILCDGIFCDGYIWRYLWDDLAKEMPVTHWHYRGHGRSSAPVDAQRISVGAHASDLQAVRRSLGDPPVVLVGHSMGCQVALEAYRRYPENVRAIVLLCGSFGRITSTFHGVPILDLILPKLIALVHKAPHIARALWSRVPVEAALKLAFKSGEIDSERVNPDDLRPYMTHMTHVDLPLFLRMLREAGDHSAWDYLPDVKVPTLIVAGERDTFTPASLARAMASAIPGSELLMLERGTHVAPIEQSELIDDAVVSFLKRALA
ncbi:alpha/beta hydrolase, partial [bacterium]